MKPMGETMLGTVLQQAAVFIVYLLRRYMQENTNGFDGTSLWIGHIAEKQPMTNLF